MEKPRITFGERLRTWGVLMGAPIFGGLLAWQLYTLSPERWCKAAYDVAKADGAGQITAYKGCLDLQAIILNIKDHAIIGLLVVLGLGYIMLAMRELRMQGEFKGPMGLGANFKPSDDPKVEGAKEVAAAAVNEAEQIEQGQP